MIIASSCSRPIFRLVIVPHLIGLVMLAGCSKRVEFDPAVALSELETVLVETPPDAEILFYDMNDLTGDSQWILSASTLPIIRMIGNKSVSPKSMSLKLPSESLVSYALSVGVPEASLSAPVEKFGDITEHQTNGRSLRLRSTKIQQGYLCVIESLR